MSEYIGSRISLISKSDIRYVGTLVEINSEQSTVSLDNVRSFGTEGRRGGKDEYAPSDAVYEQIVFRGSDVKDLRIEEPAQPKPAQPPMPDDPAIIGVQNQARQETPQNQQQRPQQPPNFPQQGQFPPGYPPYGPIVNQRFAPQGGFPGVPGPFPGGYGMPPYGGGPPGWYPGQGFNQPPGPFSPPMPIGPPGQQNQNQPPQGPKGAPTAPVGPPVNKDDKLKVAEADGATKPAETKPVTNLTNKTATLAPAAAAKQPPPPPVESKPDVAAALAPPTTQPTQPTGAPRTAPTGPKSGRIVPAVPLPSPGIKATIPHTTATQPSTTAPTQPSQAPANATQQYQNATQAATAAVAAAMAKLDLAKGPAQNKTSNDTPLDNLTRKVNEMRADDQIRHGRQPGTGGYASHRGARGGRGGRGAHHHVKMEVPTTDFDFESANAKFNKQDLVKEAIASGSPLGGDISTTPTSEATTNGHANGSVDTSADKDVIIPAAAAYDKGTSFFDNISSELKDREEAAGRRGQEFRSEERRKNMETFGQGSVDGYRGGFRGRGRGRGRGYGFGRGRGAFRGGRVRGGAQGVGES
ncbi:hypothetical protein K469DRAFT_728429 [Zopfia rhizophila CBS 207.26]|uniref:TFG box profile domain-containing protein n=1 Tax=Zopfia rhizophila CBS 207.26 TaxID=1314779 RepID=A0A6A6DYX0_9PEZI|nr:hypothetical protein K469DRAFT_728429 [Zopfia rhizophila CBS 207.26]